MGSLLERGHCLEETREACPVPTDSGCPEPTTVFGWAADLQQSKGSHVDAAKHKFREEPLGGSPFTYLSVLACTTLWY